MKIQVVKQANKTVRLMEPCPFLVEVPPEPAKQ